MCDCFPAHLRRTRLRMYKILARLRRAKILYILKKKARMRAEPGEATTFEKLRRTALAGLILPA